MVYFVLMCYCHSISSPSLTSPTHTTYVVIQPFGYFTAGMGQLEYEMSIKLQLHKQPVNYSYTRLNPTQLGADRQRLCIYFLHNTMTNDYSNNS